MPGFLYAGRDRNGVLQTGNVEATDEEEVVRSLQARGLIVTSLTKKDAQQVSTTNRKSSRRLRSRVSIDDKVLFCQQLAVLLDAGIPLLKSLEVICLQIESRPLLVALEQMRQDIEAGKTFRDAMAAHPKIFSNFWVNLVETGEASGHLSQSLNQLARYLESVREIERKAVTAVTYPAVLVVAAVFALAVFVLKIIPVFANIFVSMHITLPLLTQIVIGISMGARRYFVLWVAMLALGGWMLRRFVRTEEGRTIVDRALLKVPVFNTLFIQLQLAQFARGLSTLLESGVPILFSLEIMENSASNKMYGKAIGQVKELVREGKTMAEPLDRTGLFPPMVVQMVQVGEEIGELGKMLDRVARYYEERVGTFIDRMTVLFEPIAIIFMAFVIGTLVIAMFLPIFSLAGGGSIGNQ